MIIGLNKSLLGAIFVSGMPREPDFSCSYRIYVPKTAGASPLIWIDCFSSGFASDLTRPITPDFEVP
jgi:hypothetical protein